MYSHPFIHAEFVCSDCGPIGNFEAELRNELIAKLKNEIGVTVREVRLERFVSTPKSKRKLTLRFS
jgi:Fe2+ or Zn2+ uptake regulation protein